MNNNLHKVLGLTVRTIGCLSCDMELAKQFLAAAKSRAARAQQSPIAVLRHPGARGPQIKPPSIPTASGGWGGYDGIR